MLTVTAGQVKCVVGVSCAKGVRERERKFRDSHNDDDEADVEVA